MSGTWLLWGLLFGSIGLGYVIYGRKQKNIVAFLIEPSAFASGGYVTDLLNCQLELCLWIGQIKDEVKLVSRRAAVQEVGQRSSAFFASSPRSSGQCSKRMSDPPSKVLNRSILLPRNLCRSASDANASSLPCQTVTGAVRFDNEPDSTALKHCNSLITPAVLTLKLSSV